MPRTWLAVLATVVVLAGGCGEPAGPAEFDAAAMEADLLALVSRDRSLDNVSAGHGLDGAARVMGEIPGGGIVLSLGSLSADVGGAERPPVSLSSRDLPDSLRGRTLEWDAESGGYLVSTRVGAPSNAVRFLLYEVDETGATALPLVEAGSLEFRDQTSAERREVQLVAEMHGQIIYDYTGYATGAASVGAYGVEGSITLNGTRVDVAGDYTVDSENPAGHATSLTVSLRVPSRDFEMQYSRIDPGAPPSSEVGFDVRLEGQGGRLAYYGLIEAEGGVATFSSYDFEVNGEAYASRTQESGNAPVWTEHNGHTASVAERELFELASELSGYPITALREMMQVLEPFAEPVPSFQ